MGAMISLPDLRTSWDDGDSWVSNGSIASVLAIGSIASLASVGSIASVGSVGSIASIGSVGSIASRHGVGAICGVPVAERIAGAVGARLRARFGQPGRVAAQLRSVAEER